MRRSVPTQPVCHLCHADIPLRDHWVVLEDGLPWRVCGPHCPKREDRQIGRFDTETWRR